MLICGDFPKASRDAGSFSFQGTSIPPPAPHSALLEVGTEKGVQPLCVRVGDLPSLYLLPANPPEG